PILAEGATARIGAEPEVLDHAELRERPATFRDVCDPRAGRRFRAATQSLSAESDRARATHCAGHRPKRRRLAGAVRPQHGDDLPLADLERDPVQRLHRTVAGVDALELQQRGHAPRYASITAGSLWTWAGGPAAILRPKLSTVTWSEMPMTRFMWCSTRSTVS